MRKSILLLALFLVLAFFSSPTLAGPPINGNYRSMDLGGPLSMGRYSESWDPGGSTILPGTAVDAESWNGTSLGTEWRFTCGFLASPAVLLVNNVDGSGNGNRTFMKIFTGGRIWLSGAGPWANGDPFYSGPVANYTEFETIQYSAGVPIVSVTNIQAVAHFDNYPTDCVAFETSNGVLLGTTDGGGAKPLDYPGFLNPSTCTSTRVLGAWWNTSDMVISISNCQVGVEQTTWGRMKANYR